MSEITREVLKRLKAKGMLYDVPFVKRNLRKTDNDALLERMHSLVGKGSPDKFTKKAQEESLTRKKIRKENRIDPKKKSAEQLERERERLLQEDIDNYLYENAHQDEIAYDNYRASHMRGNGELDDSYDW